MRCDSKYYEENLTTTQNATERDARMTGINYLTVYWFILSKPDQSIPSRVDASQDIHS